MLQPLWTIVLAGGAGRRLASVTDGVPKQFWHYDGKRSLLEATLDRVAPLSSPDHTVIVVDKSHRQFLDLTSGSSNYCRVIYQPADRGTAVGVLPGLVEVLDAAPEAIVLLTPSDHGVARPDLFRSGIRAAVTQVRSGRSDVVLFGVDPITADCDYGWIGSDAASKPGAFRPVARFIEKPSPDHAAALFKSGAVWNTMVLVASATALFELYWTHLPSLASVFARALHFPPPARQTFLAEAYRTLPSADFSHQVVAPTKGLSLFTWRAEMGWSDLGTPARLEQWMRTERPTHRQPARMQGHRSESRARSESLQIA
jgi:mannose-1-phosphate guanylyltransferase